MKYILYIFLFIYFNGYSQFGPQQLISTEAHLPVCVFVADIDGDGKLDVLSASRSSNNIAWYRNMDGYGTFSSLNLIGLLSEAKSEYAEDLDNDGDIDVLATASFLDKVVWFENMDGLGNFSALKQIAGNADGAFSAIAADIDGDGDNDVISASDVSGLAWYENIDGQGNFSATKIIDNNVPNSRSVVAADLDGDGDLDLVGNGNAPDVAKIFWYENLDGFGNFGPRRVIRDVDSYSNGIFVIDADGDGDMDVFSASPGDNEIAWYKNIDGFGNFGPKIVITSSMDSAWTVYGADLDNDGDTDIISTLVETFGGEVVWFENVDGLGSFWEKQTITTEVQFPRSVIAADIDNDGDMDVIGSSQNDDKITWYENYTILEIGEYQPNNLNIYPNPTKGLVFINSKNETIISIRLFDILGKEVLQVDGNIQQLDISNLQSGMYFLQITANDRNFVEKIIKE
ncbi:MAG: T9SS type A sorting domain-containing protein [Aequorivita antarctica]